MNEAPKHTPLMQQYVDIKSQYPDTLLLFQVGDFYELFFEDAKVAASFLSITLTARGKNNGDPIPLCGVPLHAASQYINKLVKGGFKVAVCDQLEQAKPGTVVMRGVTQVITPGTITDAVLLDEKTPTTLLVVHRDGDTCALVSAELLTSQLYVTTISADDAVLLQSEIARCFASEIIMLDQQQELQRVLVKQGYYVSVVKTEQVDGADHALSGWISQFDEDNKKRMNDSSVVRSALSILYTYTNLMQPGAIETCKKVVWYAPQSYMYIDVATERNLELITNANTNNKKHTLFGVLDEAKTAMGSRMLKRWIVRPLMSKKLIEKRQGVVAELVEEFTQLHDIRKVLSQIGDIERIVGRMALRKAIFVDYVGLKNALARVPMLQELLVAHRKNQALCALAATVGDFSVLYDLLFRSMNDDETNDWIIKRGFDLELDQLRELVFDSNKKILALESQEQRMTGIVSLKIRYTNISGYYIEITNAKAACVPDRYQKTQTLVGKERFIIPELTQLQFAIEQAKDRLSKKEDEVFEAVKRQVVQYVSQLQTLAYTISYIDVLCGFAQSAYQRGYVRPSIAGDSHDIVIVQGRHPVIEHIGKDRFIPNNTSLTREQSLWIITGPNMGGKSTYLRQVALICIMAHIGAFVPAQSACIPVIDRVFTRIGAGDNLAEGKSTFLVEMSETATICNNATKNSLIILDEVGRGTSTFDGLAIAQAVVEYILTHIGAHCLFATHYHELTQLSAKHPSIVPYHMQSKKTGSGIVFLHTMSPGAADGSFGVEVAKLAQLPDEIVARAEFLVQFFKASPVVVGTEGWDIDQLRAQNGELLYQIALLQDKILQIENNSVQLPPIDYDNLSPKLAFDILWNIKAQQ